MANTSEPNFNNQHACAASASSSIAPNDELGVQNVQFKDTKIDDLNDHLDLTYNRYIQFTLPDNQVARQKAAEIEQQIETISSILEKARKEVLQQAELLKSSVNDFQGFIVGASEQWYENGDLTALTYSDLCEILEKNPVKDSKRFYEYLCRTFTTAAQVEPPTDELPAARKKHQKNQDPKTFADKVLYLVEALSHMPEGVVYAFHAYALLASTILRQYNPRCKAIEIPAHILRSELRRLAEGDRPPTYQTYRLPDVTEPTLAQCSTPKYFDFATCARAMAIEIRRPCMRQSLAYDHCHHGSVGSFLQYFQQRAYGEIKTKVFLTAGMLLPVELTDMVFEYAMQAEEMPMAPKVIIATRKYLSRRRAVARGLASGNLTEDPDPVDPRAPIYNCEKPTSVRW